MAGRCCLGLGLLLVCVFWGAWLSHITTAQVGKAKTNNKGRHYKYRQCWILNIYTFFHLNYSVTYSLTLSPSELYATCNCVTVCKHCYFLRNSGNYRTLHDKDGLNPIELLFYRFLEFNSWLQLHAGKLRRKLNLKLQALIQKNE